MCRQYCRKICGLEIGQQQLIIYLAPDARQLNNYLRIERELALLNQALKLSREDTPTNVRGQIMSDLPPAPTDRKTGEEPMVQPK